jgi:hypothetical protein
MNIRDISRIISNWNNEEIKELVFSLSDRYSDLVEDINAKTKAEGTGYILYILKQFQRGESVLKHNSLITVNEDLLKELKESLFVTLYAVCIMNNLDTNLIQQKCMFYLGDHENAEKLLTYFGSIKTIRKFTKELKKPFLSAFQFGQVVSLCIDYIIQKYCFGDSLDKEPLDERWAEYYNFTLPKLISDEMLFFDDCDIFEPDCPLIDEIRKDLSEINDTTRRQTYLYSLIIPFKEFSDVYHPTAMLERYGRDIQSIEKSKEYKKFKERILWINKCFIEINCKETFKYGSVEYNMKYFFRVATTYANRLDVLLLENGIDLMQLQKDCEVYLIDHRCITDVVFYIGLEELANKYINALPKIIHHTAGEEEDVRNIKPANTNNYEGKQDNLIPTAHKVIKNEYAPQFSEAAFEELKNYFNNDFKGIIKNSINWFEHLEADIKRFHSKKELAAIALMIQESKYSQKIPSKFTDWVSKFFGLFGLGSTKYRPSHLRTEIELMKKKNITYL